MYQAPHYTSGVQYFTNLKITLDESAQEKLLL